MSDATDTQNPNDDRVGGTDHRQINIPDQTDDPELDGFTELRERKDELGLTWLEFINGQADEIDQQIADRVADAVDADFDTDELSQAITDAVSRAVDAGDIRQAAYEGAKEGIQETARQ